jgi:hypothetical protein
LRAPASRRAKMPAAFCLARFVISGWCAHIPLMPRKPIELPPAVARGFVRDMKAYFADKNTIKRDEIAARQLHALKQHLRSTDKELKMTDVREMFRQMRDC